MKKLSVGIVIFLLVACSSTRLVDRWQNSEVNDFKPEKVMIMGITQNLTARKIFEQDLRDEFLKRNINAVESSTILGDTFTQSLKTEQEIDALKDELIANGFDTLIVTAVKGVDDVHTFRPDHTWPGFGRYYYRYQDIYYNPGYYDDYKVYRVETSIYNIKDNNGKSLVWVGDFEIVDPQKISSSVGDYVKAITNKLEDDKILPVVK